MPNITYQIIYSKRRTVSLVVNREGQLVVRAPKRVSRAEIERLVQEKSDWVQKVLEKAKQRQIPKKQFAEGELFWYLGKQHPLRFSLNKRPASMEQGELWLWQGADAKKALTKWYKTRAQEILQQRAGELSAAMGLRFNRVTVRSSQTRWGSCSVLGNINFSYRLIMAPPEIVDYVIIHELAHLVHKNHSQKFWNLVSQYFPNPKLARNWLNANGHQLVV